MLSLRNTVCYYELHMYITSLHCPVCASSVVRVDVCFVFILAHLLEAFLLGAIFLPLAAPGGAGRDSRLVAVAGSSERHP